MQVVLMAENLPVAGAPRSAPRVALCLAQADLFECKPKLGLRPVGQLTGPGHGKPRG
jgi:hypothetical protein